MEYIKNRVFVLGAGFSAAAGIPLTGELLSIAMQMFSRECPGIFTRVNNYAKTCFSVYQGDPDYSKESLSQLCTFLEFIELREYGGGERWSYNGSREKLALRYYLAKTLVERCPDAQRVPDLYLSLRSNFIKVT
jgi:hypothetical protein